MLVPQLTTMIRQSWNLLVKHFSTIISFLGFAATLYFGIFYVPEFVTEYKTFKKDQNINEVIQTSKELIYSDSISNYSEIKNLIKSKEAKYGKSFNKDPQWFLFRVEESFLEDKFLSLSKRRELIREIDLIISQIPEKDLNLKTDEEEEYAWIYFVSIPLTFIIVGLGIYSLIVRYKIRKREEEEIKNEVDQAKYELGATRDLIAYKEEEKTILETLSSLNYEFHYYDNSDKLFDLDFYHNNRRYFLEVKTLRRSKVGLRSISEFLNKLSARNGVGIFIYNTALTPMSEQKLKEFNENRKDAQAYAIEYNRKTLKADIKRVVDETA